jgi:hypothetical protein
MSEKQAGLTATEYTYFAPSGAGAASKNTYFFPMDKITEKSALCAGYFTITINEKISELLKGTILFESGDIQCGPLQFTVEAEKPAFNCPEVNVAYNTYIGLCLEFTV